MNMNPSRLSGRRGGTHFNFEMHLTLTAVLPASVWLIRRDELRVRQVNESAAISTTKCIFPFLRLILNTAGRRPRQNPLNVKSV